MLPSLGPSLVAIFALSYTCYSYVSLVDEPFDPWADFVLKSISVLLQAVVVYTDIYTSYPMVFYNDENYRPSYGILIAKYTLWTAYVMCFGFIVMATIVFLPNAENRLGALMFHLISFFLLIATVLAFVTNSFSHYSGEAYCDFLDKRNNTLATRCWLPSSLCEAEMEIYKREFYLVNKTA